MLDILQSDAAAARRPVYAYAFAGVVHGQTEAFAAVDRGVSFDACPDRYRAATPQRRDAVLHRILDDGL